MGNKNKILHFQTKETKDFWPVFQNSHFNLFFLKKQILQKFSFQLIKDR